MAYGKRGKKGGVKSPFSQAVAPRPSTSRPSTRGR